MKVELESVCEQHPGIKIMSETPEEAQRLKDIWCGHGVIASLMRLILLIV